MENTSSEKSAKSDEQKLAVLKNNQQSAKSAEDVRPEAGQLTQETYPAGMPLFLICLGLFLGVLCVALDRAIIATAVPKITTEFNSLADVGWYGSAYLLTSCCFQLMFGKLYAEYSIKSVFLAALLIFEVGSVVCATAPNSPALIVGRAVAGLGSAGVVTGALTILAHSVPLHKRPKFTGAIGGASGIAVVMSPTLGGVFTDYATWRWCFWINLPLGAVGLLTVVIFVRFPTKKRNEAATSVSILEKVDFLGTIFLMPSILCLLLALQWGGSQYPWSDWRLILLLVIFGLFITAWVAVQVRQGDKATVPIRIITMRSIACAVWLLLCLSAVAVILVYFVPIWFQAVLNVSAHQSGINYLAIAISNTIMAIMSGFITSKVGYYVPQMIASSAFSSVACGLIYQFGLNTSTGYWIGSLILLGLGIGAGAQQSFMVPQTVLSGSDIALGTSLMVFSNTISGAIFLSVAENIFQERLIAELHAFVSEVNPEVVIAAGANGLVASMQKVYPQFIQPILESYAKALQSVFIIPLVMACVSMFGSALMEWRSVRKDVDKEKGARPKVAVEHRPEIKWDETEAKNGNKGS